MYIEVHDLSSVFTKSVCTARRAQCSWLLLTWHKSSRRTRYSNFFVCIRLKRYSHVTRNTKREDVISFLWYIHANAIRVCVCERERESQWKQSAGRTASTTQTLAKYSINTAKVCVCLLTFFVCFRLKSYSQVMRNTEKSMSSHRFGILRHCNLCECMHVSHWKESAGRTASMTHKTCEHKTKKIQRQRCMCHNEKT